MKSLYESILESILSSTGSGMAHLKDQLLKIGWKIMNGGKGLVHPDYKALSEFLGIREDGTLYVDIHPNKKTTYRYNITEISDIQFVTEYWRFYNNFYLHGNRHGFAKMALDKAYKELRIGLKSKIVK